MTIEGRFAQTDFSEFSKVKDSLAQIKTSSSSDK